MREIKFRGMRVDNGEWVYGDLMHVSGFGTKHVQIYRDEIDEQKSPEVNPATVEVCFCENYWITPDEACDIMTKYLKNN